MFEGIYPLWVGIIIGLAINFLAHFVTKKLPDDIKKLSFQKISSIALIPMAVGVFFSFPYVSSWTTIDDTKTMAVDSLNTIEKVADFQKIQSQRIEKLNYEVVKLRTDISNINDYLRLLMQFFLTFAISWGINSYISKNKQINEIILDEKRRDKTLNL
jgi:predicted PurR-regulated permease PerM